MTNIRIVLFLFKFNCIMCPFFSQWVPNTCGQLFWSEPPQPLIVIFVNNGNANKKWMPDLDRNKFNLTHDFYSLIGPKIGRLKRRYLLVLMLRSFRLFSLFWVYVEDFWKSGSASDYVRIFRDKHPLVRWLFDPNFGPIFNKTTRALYKRICQHHSCTCFYFNFQDWWCRIWSQQIRI